MLNRNKWFYASIKTYILLIYAEQKQTVLRVDQHKNLRSPDICMLEKIFTSPPQSLTVSTIFTYLFRWAIFWALQSLHKHELKGFIIKYQHLSSLRWCNQKPQSALDISHQPPPSHYYATPASSMKFIKNIFLPMITPHIMPWYWFLQTV
jgi:hypothetical protein